MGGLLKLGEVAMKSLLESDRCNIWLVDEAKKELWSLAGESAGGIEVRHKMGEGILGHVIDSGKVVKMGGGGNLDLSSGFDVRVDSDYKTTSLLCVPIWNVTGR